MISREGLLLKIEWLAQNIADLRREEALDLYREIACIQRRVALLEAILAGGPR
jgi:hypothetical protein